MKIYYTDCIKMVQAEQIILDMIFSQNVCVFIWYIL